MPRALDEAEVIFVGGGNTFRLLKRSTITICCHRRVAAGVPYIRSSAGSIVAWLTLKTTKDMPVVQPPSFEAWGLVPFQISPHYQDPDPASTHWKRHRRNGSCSSSKNTKRSWSACGRLVFAGTG